jgi:hypothetical protein
MARRPSDPPDPPQPPDFGRKIDLRLPHAVGAIALSLVVVLAIAGVFDTRSKEVTGSLGAIDITIQYPSRMRYHETSAIEVSMAYDASAIADSIRMTVSSAYLERFESVTYVPEAGRPGLLVVVPDRNVGERSARVEMRAARPGMARGTVRVEGPDEHVEFPIHTMILP